ncbi:hypothetical protein GWI33_021816 [Rhynchophorus ferrugineus]|uniref:Uncharacterized protein n=1 Tax=Rhynchophorus ferrugineus TaxID=354439 RepID=A0A834MMU7_RHYFE|nr:hypothetical protein GWI33_021816 [Rhynchophorus ferrugineus]
MFRLVLFGVLVSVPGGFCFSPNCVRENQFKFYGFPVEGCSKFLQQLCMPVYSGQFEVMGSPTIVKVKATTVLPTCAFYNVDTLEHIYGVKSKIKILAKGAFIKLPNLRSIDLSYNMITEVRDKVFQNVSTEKLDLSWNNILFVDPDAFKEVYNLRELDLSRNALMTIPIHQLPKSITTLNLAYNELTRVAINSLKFTNLTNVNLSNNRIQNVAISFFYPLDTFDLSNNELYDIDYVEISSVNTFRIGSNNFRLIPKYLENINANNINIYPNPWSCEVLPDLWRTMSSLNYRIETTGSGTQTMEICTNITTVGTFRQGDKSCVNDRQCPTNQVCKVGQCLDPCSSFCHQTSVCKAKNHQFRCACPKGTKSDPMDLTGSCNKVQCYVSSQCPLGKYCVQNRCKAIAGSTTVGPPSELPNFIPEIEVKPWWFEDIPYESPIKVFKLATLPPIPEFITIDPVILPKIELIGNSTT